MKERILYIKREDDGVVFAYKAYEYSVAFLIPLIIISIILIGLLIMMKLHWSVAVFIMIVIYFFILPLLFGLRDLLNKRVEQKILQQVVPIQENEIKRSYTRKPQKESMTNSIRTLTILCNDNTKKTYQVDKIDQVANIIVLKVNIKILQTQI